MAITRISTGTTTSTNSATHTPTIPTGLAGDLLLMWLFEKPSVANAGADPTSLNAGTGLNWTLVAKITGVTDGDTGGYGTTLGADTGNVNAWVYMREATGAEAATANVVFSNGATNFPNLSRITRYRKTSTTWDVVGITGKQTSAGNISITYSSDPGIKAGDYLAGIFCTPTDGIDYSNYTSSQDGVCFDGWSELAEMETANGNDVGGSIFEFWAAEGMSLGTAPTAGCTVSVTTNARGPSILVRMRETGDGYVSIIGTGGSGAAQPTSSSHTTRVGTGQDVAVLISTNGTTDTDPRVQVNGDDAYIVRRHTYGAGGSTRRQAIALLGARKYRHQRGQRISAVHYWESATLHLSNFVELGDADQRTQVTSDTEVFSNTTGTTANLNIDILESGSGILSVAGMNGGGGTWSPSSGQTEIVEVASLVGGYDIGLAPGTEASNWTVSVTASAIGQLALALAPRLQDVSAFSPFRGETGVNPSIASLELTMQADAVEGDGYFYLYETITPSTERSIGDRNTSSKDTNTGTSITITWPNHASIVAGDLVILCVSRNDNSNRPPTNPDPTKWRFAFADTFNDSASYVMFCFCDGTEAGGSSTFNLELGLGQNAIARTWHVPGGAEYGMDGIRMAVSRNGNGNITPLPLSVPWSGPTKRIIWSGMDGNSTASAYPSGWDNTGSAATSDATTGNRVGHAYCELVSSNRTEYPTVFTNTSAAWVCFHFAIKSHDPSTLVESINVSDCVFSSDTVTIPINSNLDPETTYRVESSDNAVVGWEGLDEVYAWPFTTGGDENVQNSLFFFGGMV